MCPPANTLCQFHCTVPLYNKYQCLQDLCESHDIDVHNKAHMIKSRKNLGIIKYFQVLHVERKITQSALRGVHPPQSCSNNMLQSLLADQTKNLLQGNKNKTGSLTGVFNNVEEQENGKVVSQQNEIGLFA